MANKRPSVEHLRHLYVQQRKGKSKAARTRARNELVQLTKRMQSTANRRLREIRASDFAYGSTYDMTENYLEQKGDRYFKLPTEARRGRTNTETGEKYPLTNETYNYAIRLQSFLASKETTVSGQRRIEKDRFATYRANFPYANEMSDGVLRDFLKFLGNSGVKDYLDYYGEASGDEVEELADIFAHSTEEEDEKLKQLFSDYAKYADAAEKVKRGELQSIPKELRQYKFSNLRKELDTLYESIEKRSR